MAIRIVDDFYNAIDNLEGSLGTTSDAAVASASSGSVNARLRQASADLAAILVKLADPATQTTLASLLTTTGATADAAATMGSTGTLSAKLRQISTDIGASADAVVAVGAAGTVAAKLRRLTTDLGVVAATLAAGNFGVIADAAVAVGGAGTVFANLRRLTTDLGALVTALSTTNLGVAADATIVPGATGSVHAKLRQISANLASSNCSALVTGVKTATSTAAEVFAVSAKVAARTGISIYNEGPDNLEIGISSLAVGTGWLMFPGDTFNIKLNPQVVTAVYALSPSTATYRVVEVSA